MGFIIFIVILFGGLGYGAYYLIDFAFPALFPFLVGYLPLSGWILVIGSLIFLLLGAGLKEPK